MRILIACEESGTVRDAFIKRGHDAVSCDIIPTSSPGPHIQGDVLEVIHEGWDMMIAFPPCTYLTVTGNKWFKPEYRDRFPAREWDRCEAIAFFMRFVNAPIPRIAIENPLGIMSTVFQKPDQIIQPYFFGDAHSKKTCLWLKGLPPLMTKIIDEPEFTTFKSGKRMPKWYCDAGRKGNRAGIRSKTFQGIADAMADQWG